MSNSIDSNLTNSIRSTQSTCTTSNISSATQAHQTKSEIHQKDNDVFCSSNTENKITSIKNNSELLCMHNTADIKLRTDL